MNKIKNKEKKIKEIFAEFGAKKFMEYYFPEYKYKNKDLKLYDVLKHEYVDEKIIIYDKAHDREKNILEITSINKNKMQKRPEQLINDIAKYDQPYHGMDQLYIDDKGNILIVEVKWGKNNNPGITKKGPQMSHEWLVNTVNKLDGSNEVFKKQIQDALKVDSNKQVKGLVLQIEHEFIKTDKGTFLSISGKIYGFEQSEFKLCYGKIDDDRNTFYIKHSNTKINQKKLAHEILNEDTINTKVKRIKGMNKKGGINYKKHIITEKEIIKEKNSIINTLKKTKSIDEMKQAMLNHDYIKKKDMDVWTNNEKSIEVSIINNDGKLKYQIRETNNKQNDLPHIIRLLPINNSQINHQDQFEIKKIKRDETSNNSPEVDSAAHENQTPRPEEKQKKLNNKKNNQVNHLKIENPEIADFNNKTETKSAFDKEITTQNAEIGNFNKTQETAFSKKFDNLKTNNNDKIDEVKETSFNKKINVENSEIGNFKKSQDSFFSEKIDHSKTNKEHTVNKTQQKFKIEEQIVKEVKDQKKSVEIKENKALIIKSKKNKNGKMEDSKATNQKVENNKKNGIKNQQRKKWKQKINQKANNKGNALKASAGKKM
ncbi:hypothetical protein MHK_006227 [Candidatus Magnetomorum sp. HK-1]|nr:hypothetical protein MHK_006227 [Candidatus Magnetomorum sp. HK-1]